MGGSWNLEIPEDQGPKLEKRYGLTLSEGMVYHAGNLVKYNIFRLFD
jgi:hypothetical protein